MAIRVLHFTTDSRIAGAEKLLIGIAKQFNRSKFELFFCTLKEKGALHKELEKLGQKTFSLNCSRILNLPIAGLKLIRILDTYKIDILHTHLYHASILGQFVTQFRRHILGIITRHYSDLLYLYGNRMQRVFDRYASNLARHIIAISEGVKEVLVNLDKINSEKITIIHNGIDISEFDPQINIAPKIKQDYCINNGTKIIGAIGSLHPRKGHQYLIKAADVLCRKRNDVKFLIVGEGALKEKLTCLRDDFGLEDKVIFTGYRSDIIDIISDIDIFVQPSVEEGFGLSIIEAMILGKPVIASNVGGVPEIIEDKKTGLLIPSKNPIALTSAVQSLLEEPDKAKKMGEAARKIVQEKFNLSTMVRKYEELYEKILGEI